MIKKFIVILIILCSLLFYDFKFLGKYSKLIELAGIGIMIVVSIIYSIYDDSHRFKHHFSSLVIMILIALPISMYMANLFHNQSIGVSLYSQRSIYYYFLYFLLHQLKIKPKDFEKIFIVLAIVYVIFYLLQYTIYPRVIFNTTIFKDRGTLRISINGLSFMLIGYFLSLQYVLRRNQPKYIILMVASYIIVILVGSRLLLFSVAAVTMLNLVIEKRIQSRLAIYLLVLSGLIFLFLAFQNVFQEMLSVTKETRSQGMDYIRVRAARYFLSRFFPNKLTYLFGNGASSANSEYSSYIDFLSKKYGYYLSDIGIIGNYVNFGILFVIGVLGILYKTIKSKIQPGYHYIKYFFILNALCIIVAGGFAQSDFIVLVTISLYMIDVSKSMADAQKPGMIQTSQDNPVLPEEASDT